MKSLSNKNPGPIIEIPETSLKKTENNDTQNEQDKQTNTQLEVYTAKERFINLLTIDNAKNTFLFCGAWGLIYCFLIMPP